MAKSGLIIKEIPYRDPLSIFTGLQHKKWALLLDSALHNAHYGRYCYIAVDPFKVLCAKDGQVSVDDAPVNSEHNPFDLLKALLNQMPGSNHPDLPPFQGGAAGAFAYDLHQYIEAIPTNCSDELYFPDMAIGFYDVVISFDAVKKKAWIVSTGWPEKTPEMRLARATERLNAFTDLVASMERSSLRAIAKQSRVRSSEPWIASYLATTRPASSFQLFVPKVEALATTTGKLTEGIEPYPLTEPNISSTFNATTYSEAVNRVIDYIIAGDIFEANISQCFKSKLPAGMTPFSLYQRLRERNPAPFAAFMNLGDTYVISASPERFLQLSEGFVETRPIKGTRPRHANPKRDQQLAAELKASEKDIAENVMIVDLLRNDLSKVCKDHSINVTQLCGLESYATVHHLVSVVTGELKQDQDAIDLLMAAFPGGSITGAPKIRAMQIIAEIEPTKRGIYCGSIGFIGFNATMDTSIAIRTYTIKEDVVTFQAGGAIVADSNPTEEYQETLTKSAALHDALTRQP